MVAITRTDEQSMKILNLFANNHRFTEERFALLSSWFGLPCNNQESFQPIFEERMKFLESIWDKDYFRPFDHVQAAEYYLMANIHIGYLIRLSSQPGKITITKRNKTGTIYHTRYSIIQGGKLEDFSGNTFECLHELCSIVSLTSRFPSVATYLN